MLKEKVAFKEYNDLQIKEFIEKKCIPIKAIKDKSVQAYQINKKEAELIVKKGLATFSYDKFGNFHKETINKKVFEGDYMVTQIINRNSNCYIVPAEKFEKKYFKTKKEGVYQPKSAEITVYKIPENFKVSFKASWGELLFLSGSGVIVIEGDGKGVYGVNKEEFEATYSYIKNKKLKRGCFERKKIEDNNMTDQFFNRDLNKRSRFNALLEKGWAEKELAVEKEKEKERAKSTPVSKLNLTHKEVKKKHSVF